MTWFVLLCVAIGVAVGLTGILPTTHLDTVIMAILFLLVFAVGLDLGARGDAWKQVRSLGPRLIAVPFASAVGSITGVALMSTYVWDYPWRIACALGSAFGWYSLSGPLLTHLAGPDIGALAFLSDVMCEFAALVLIPYGARYSGNAEAVALGGATSMDTTLPLIARASDGRATPLAFAHGLLIGLLVPVLIPLWFSI